MVRKIGGLGRYPRHRPQRLSRRALQDRAGDGGDGDGGLRPPHRGGNHAAGIAGQQVRRVGLTHQTTSGSPSDHLRPRPGGSPGGDRLARCVTDDAACEITHGPVLGTDPCSPHPSPLTPMPPRWSTRCDVGRTRGRDGASTRLSKRCIIAAGNLAARSLVPDSRGHQGRWRTRAVAAGRLWTTPAAADAQAPPATSSPLSALTHRPGSPREQHLPASVAGRCCSAPAAAPEQPGRSVLAGHQRRGRDGDVVAVVVLSGL